MKLHRFITTATINDQAMTIEDPAICHQIKRVLRLKVGEEVIVVGEGNKEYTVAISEFLPNQIITKIVREEKNTREPEKYVRLYCSILKRENFELVVQKATEVGVKEIIPLICDRTIKLGVKYARLETIAKEAVEQSGRGMVPAIHEAISFGEAVQQISKDEEQYFLDFDGRVLQEMTGGKKKVRNIFIGPEGGWSEEERELAKNFGLTFISLGPLTLRAETAAIVAGYAIVHS